MLTKFVAILFTAGSLLPLMAQESRGSIAGRVQDPSGGLVAGARVRATSNSTGVSAAADSNKDGLYSIPLLLPGVYTVTAEMPGFKRTERTSLEVRVNDKLNVDLQLELGNTSESVEVTAAAPLLESTNASMGQVVDQRRIKDLPLQAGNPAELILFAPGVVNTANLRARKTSFNSASSQFSTNGNDPYSNEYTVDGVADTFASQGTPLVAFQPPQSAVTEFRVQTSGYDASLGHSPGAVVNLISSGGTNQFHGELHEWFSNSALDAPTFFQNASGGAKPVYQDNRYGASIGGPIFIPKLYNGHNRTFFFYAWEANKWGKPTTTVGTVPTIAERNGDFSALLALGSRYQIYDPATTRPASGGRYSRSPFVGNQIPVNRLDPVALNIQKFYPLPNTIGLADGENNYTRITKDTFDYFVHFVRLDHQFSEKNRLFVRLDYDHYLETNSNFYSNIATGLNLTRINRGAAFDDVIVLSPTSVLDLRYGITYEETPEQRRSRGFDLASLGFSPQLLSLLDPKTQTFPNVYINSKAPNAPCKGACTGTFSGFGNFQAGDGTITGMIHDWTATVNSQLAKHNVRYGADLRLYRSFGFAGGYDVSPGFNFLPTYTNGPFNNAAVSPIGQDYASFLLSIPSGQMTRSASYAAQDFYSGLFIQDDWKVSSRLTLNLGLRAEIETPETERYNRAIRGFDGTSPNPIAAQAIANYAASPIAAVPVSQFQVRGGLLFTSPNNRNLWSQPAITWLPRFGLAYQLGPNTVLRTGFGIFYDTIGVNRSPAIQTGFTATTPIIPSYDNGVTFVANNENPFPNGLASPVGAAAGLTTNLGQSLNVYPINRLQPYSQRWSFDIERTLPAGFLLDVGYVGNKAIHLPVSRNLNATPAQYLSTSPVRDQATINYLSQQVANPFFGINSVYPKTMAIADLLRPYPQFGDIITTDNNGYSWYHALQVRAEKRFSKGYTLNAAYTWSKFMGATGYLNDSDASLYRGLNQYDRPQRVVVSGIYELPFGRGRAFGAGLPRAWDMAVGGWQLNASVTVQSGQPLSFGDVIFYGNSYDQVALPSSARNVSQWFDTSLFDRVSGDQRQYDIRTFPSYLAQVRAPGQSQWNASLFKSFDFTERWKLQFRAECYDLLNHPNFEKPSTTVTSSTFGVISSQGSPGRQFQAALKLTF
jgi:hypothetical protein